MDYNEVPTAIKVLKDNCSRCTYILNHDIPRFQDSKTGEVKMTVGDRTVSVNVQALKEFLSNQMSENSLEVERLEDIHNTLMKVSVGLISK